jgi:NADH-quinone oxidoreductase subunit H
VGGFHTEYSSLKFALFFLAEYVSMATVSAMATTLFLGGWQAPWGLVHLWPGANEGYWPLLWFFGKVLLFIFFFIWLRGSLPRLRYDQFMALGWKVLIPISLAWIIAVATVRAVTLQGGVDRQYLLIGVGVIAAVFVVLMFVGSDEEEATAEVGATDPFAGGFPVPPMPEGAVRGPARALRFDTGSTVRQSAPERGTDG